MVLRPDLNIPLPVDKQLLLGSDDNGNTLAYDGGFIDCYLNGVKLINGTDVTVTSGTSVVLLAQCNCRRYS